MIMQKSFDPFDYEDNDRTLEEAIAVAKQKRDEEYQKLKAEGVQAKRWVLRGQLRKYKSFGVEDGRSRDVFMLDIFS
jgi:hypothetical protein